MQVRSQSLPPLPLSPVKNPDKPGLVLVQVDGLSHDHLQRALDEGLMPNLKRRLEEGKLEEAQWHCGLPSQTVVVQSGVLYGNDDLPANQWLEKSTGKYWNTMNPDDMDDIEERIAGRNEGLIQGGSSYLTCVAGQPNDSFFALSEMGQVKEEKGLKGLLKEAGGDLARITARLWQHPIKAVKTVGRFASHVVHEYKHRKEENMPADTLKEKLFPPIEHAFKEVWLPYAVAEHMADGIEKGKPVLFVDFANFDEVSHTYGPGKAAFESLRHVDRNLQTLFEAVDKADRPYNVCLFSDHGQVAGVSFKHRYGQTLEQFTQSLLPEGEKVFVQDIGSAAHLWFTDKEGMVDRDQVNPKVLDTMKNHEAIAFTVTRDGKATVIEGKTGTIRVEDDKIETTGENPLTPFGSSDTVIHHLHDMAHRPDAGDLIVFGVLEGEGILDFGVAGLRGLHGGIGHHQDEPFVAWSKGLDIEPSELKTATDLYAQLREKS